jgi:putative ABC transport system ATP-binding protein
MHTLFSLKAICKEHKLGTTKVTALKNINLNLGQSQSYAVVGPSGSGKSSLLHLLGMMDSPSSGKIYFKGNDISNLKESVCTKIRAQEIGFIFQAFFLNPVLTVEQNVALSLRILGFSRRKSLQQSEVWLHRVGLFARRKHKPFELSGGERQRVAIARALVKKPSVILADEPTGNLDTKTGKQIVDLLLNINKESKTTLILVTHNTPMAAMLNKMIQLKDGQVWVNKKK